MLNDDFASSPTQVLELGGLVSNFAFYALDSNSRMPFQYGAKTKWNVEAVPLSMVQRFEHLTKTSTTINTSQNSSGKLSSTASSNTQNSLRFHIIDSNGRPQQFVVPFGNKETELQDWITELNYITSKG